jgi:hypothetical protein
MMIVYQRQLYIIVLLSVPHYHVGFYLSGNGSAFLAQQVEMPDLRVKKKKKHWVNAKGRETLTK